MIKPLTSNNPYVVKSSTELINKITNLKLKKTTKFYSFDVISLYPSVPINEVKKIILEKCKEDSKLKDKYDFIKDSLELIFQSNVFAFGSKIYLQQSGVGMGSVLGPTLGDFTMEYIEKTTLGNNPLKPLLYARYVDDILIFWEFTEKSLLELKEKMAKVFPTINFTVERESNYSIPFLDLTIHRSRDNSKIWTNVFYKVSAPLNIISASSNTYKKYLYNAITPLYRRALSHTTFQHHENMEIHKVTKEAISKGFKIEEINRIKSKIFNNKDRGNENDGEFQRKRLKYIGSIQFNNKLFPIINAFQKLGYGIAFRNKKLKEIIVNDRDYPLQKGGIYEIPIQNENGTIVKYYGKTRRSLYTRKLEHINSLSSPYSNTALKEYLFDNPTATPLWKDATILKSPQSDDKLNIMENVIIWKNIDNAINIVNNTGLMSMWQPCLSLATNFNKSLATPRT